MHSYMNYNLLKRLAFLPLLLSLLAVVTSCEEEDFVVTENTDNDLPELVSITRIVTHSMGQGFPIIIMGDGYSQTDINNGTYQTAVDNTVNALFENEPMASLRQYCDVYQVVCKSAVSGITTEKRNTCFGARMKSTDDVVIYGDSIKAMTFAAEVLDKYNGRLSNSQVIVLLNSKQYAGVTLMAQSAANADSVPNGYALSYVPASCYIRGTDYFSKVLQHEVVGHGIGKLHDEYIQEFDEPTQSKVTDFKNCQKTGMYLNIMYDENANDIYDGTYAQVTNNNKTYKVIIGSHDIEPGNIGYAFTQNAAYTAEDLKWYQGGATYLTIDKLYTGTDYRYATYYTAKKNFYRPTLESLMNAVTSKNSGAFNVLSRYLIYARIMRVANGGTSENIHSEALHTQFMEFDKGTTQSSQAAKSVGGMATEAEETVLPPLARPVIIKLWQ